MHAFSHVTGGGRSTGGESRQGLITQRHGCPTVLSRQRRHTTSRVRRSSAPRVRSLAKPNTDNVSATNSHKEAEKEQPPPDTGRSQLFDSAKFIPEAVSLLCRANEECCEHCYSGVLWSCSHCCSDPWGLVDSVIADLDVGLVVTVIQTLEFCLRNEKTPVPFSGGHCSSDPGLLSASQDKAVLVLGVTAIQTLAVCLRSEKKRILWRWQESRQDKRCAGYSGVWGHQECNIALCLATSSGCSAQPGRPLNAVSHCRISGRKHDNTPFVWLQYIL
jgi:hypothetical protein